MKAGDDGLSVHGIRRHLSAPALRYADKIHIYPLLASTNATAKEMAENGAEHGEVVLAERQSAGKGRYDRGFFSPPGGLYISLILDPKELPFSHVTSVTIWAAVAVCEAIESVCGAKIRTCKAQSGQCGEESGIAEDGRAGGNRTRLQIKWVNDILLDGRKVCGILAEAVPDPEGGGLRRIVLGIGINVHAHMEDFPTELRLTATSIDPMGQIPDAKERLAAGLISRILGCGSGLREKEILEKYRKRLGMLGTWVTVYQNRDESRNVSPAPRQDTCREGCHKEHRGGGRCEDCAPRQNTWRMECGKAGDAACKDEDGTAQYGMNPEKRRKAYNTASHDADYDAYRETYRAKALDVDEEGHLIVRKETGETIALSSGEIRVRISDCPAL